MYVDSTTDHLRTLAKSSYYQTMFTFMKEGPFQLFENVRDLTSLQLEFLVYLSFYHAIQTDIYLGEVDEQVLDNYVYEDAYCTYKNEQRKRQPKLTQPVMTAPTTSHKKETKAVRDQWLFKSRPKRK